MRYRFLTNSSGGSHSGKDWQRTGYCGLGTAVQKLGLGIDKDVSVDFVVRSSYLYSIIRTTNLQLSLHQSEISMKIFSSQCTWPLKVITQFLFYGCQWSSVTIRYFDCQPAGCLLVFMILTLKIGDNGLKEYEWRTNKSSKSKVETRDERKLSDRLETHFRIYFPTRETVAQSKGGIGVRV